MLALFPIVEDGRAESIWSPNWPKFGLQPHALDLTDMLSDVMAVENSPAGSDRDVIPPIRLRLLCQHATDQFAVVRFRLLWKERAWRDAKGSGHPSFFAQNARPPNCFKMDLQEFVWFSHLERHG